MKILYGTGNIAKINSMKNMLRNLEIEIISLNDVNLKVEKIYENGNSPLENAKIKAFAYYKVWGKPVFSCDSALYIDRMDFYHQPGVHVRRINGGELNDEEMIKYYTELASKAGGEVKAKYKNAICLILDEKKVFEYDGNDIAEEFIITSEPHKKRKRGFPLDSISKDIKTGRYYMDLSYYTESQKNMINGFRDFFIRSLVL